MRMNHDSYPDAYIHSILNETKTIAMVGASANTSRPSYFAFKYLLEKGFKVVPVNPALERQEILGQKVYASLKDIPFPVDMVDIFRNSEAALEITKESIAIKAKVVWMQLMVLNDEAAKLAEAAGLRVVMNRCPKIEYGRLSKEISWMGVNSGQISARKTQMSGNGFQRLTLSSKFKKI